MKSGIVKSIIRIAAILLIFSAFLFVAPLLPVGQAQASLSLYASYTTGDSTGIIDYGVYWLAQTFTASPGHEIAIVQLLLYRLGSPGTITVSIKATDGSAHPTGADLCSGILNGNALTTDTEGAWYQVTFDESYNLVNGTKYAIVARAPAGNGSNCFYWRCDSTLPTLYIGGRYESSTNSGSTWAGSSSQDFMFREWGEDPPDLYEHDHNTDYASTSLYGAIIGGQSFTPSENHKITSVNLYMHRFSYPGEITVSVKATDIDGKPNGPELCSGTTNGDNLTTSIPSPWRRVYLGVGYWLTADTKYAIIVSAVSGNTSNYLFWRNDNNGNTYPSYGCELRSNDGGATWSTYPTSDLLFEEYGEEPSYDTEILRPNGTGDYTNIGFQYPETTYHWDKIDDIIADDDSTYVLANISQDDAYNLENSNIPSGMIIDSVIVHFRCRGDEYGYSYAKPKLRLGSDETEGTQVSPPAAWTDYEEELSRPGGGNWSVEDLDDLQGAIYLNYGTSDYGYCTQIYIEISYFGSPDPVVTTQDATVTSNITATGNGNITSLILTPCDERGFEWDIDSGEPYSNNATDTGSFGTGAYTKAITGLPPGTTIYYRAIAHNSIGWAYGDEMTLLTFDHPTLITHEASSVGAVVATFNGEITSIGGDVSCTERGFVYDTITHPDPGESPPISSGYSDNYSEFGIYVVGSFNTIINNLTEDEEYFVRTYSYNTYGYSYGDEITFTTYSYVCWIEWEYGDTFHDFSGYDNDAIPTFLTNSSDTDVTAVLSSYLPIETAQAPEYTVTEAPSFITANITTSGNFTSGNVPTGGPPGFDVVEDAATSSGTPNIWLWGILGGFTIAMAGLGISFMEKKYGAGGGSLLLRIGIAVAIIGLMVAFKKFDFWMLLFYIIITASLAMMSRHIDFGGAASEHNLIGFLAMSWIGLTLINRIVEGQFLTANERIWANYYAFTQDFKLFNIFSVPVLNLDFFTQGIPTLIRWDYSFFGGNAQLIQYLLYSITAVVSFIIFLAIIGLLYNFFNRLR